MRGTKQVLGTALGVWLFATAAEGSSLADAAEQQKWSEVRALAGNPAHKAEINSPQADGSTALLWAAHHDDAAVVSLLLEQGAQPDLANRYGLTPLSAAALNGNADIVGRLLAAGANPNKAAEGGDTPLMIAARTGNSAAVKLLLDKGASVDARDEWHGETALMWAAGENHADVVRLLVAAGADVNAASTTFDWKDIKHGGVQSQLPKGGLTALMHAVRQNAYDAVVALLELGADPNLKEPQGISTLRIAAANGHLDIAQVLIDRGADPDEGALAEAVRTATTPMMRAATNRVNRATIYDVVKNMLDHGAKADSLGTVPMPKKDAFGGGAGANAPSETALYFAANGGDLELMRLMLDHGANPNHATRTGATPLMAALETIQRRPQAQGSTPPPRRSVEDRQAAAKLLLERGADINAKDGAGMTALHWMADQGANDLIAFIVAHGGRLDAKDNSNRTALDLANGIAAIRAPNAPGLDPGPITHEGTVTFLRELMASAGVREMPYVAPGAQAASATAAPARQKTVTAIIGGGTRSQGTAQ
jgi:ankyrin repeat protein